MKGTNAKINKVIGQPFIRKKSKIKSANLNLEYKNSKLLKYKPKKRPTPRLDKFIKTLFNLIQKKYTQIHFNSEKKNT